MDDERFDVIVIGTGPGGEVASSRLIDGGKRVALIERELIGGECGYWACIPSKTLLRGPEAAAASERAPGTDRPDVDWPRLRDYRDYMVRHFDDAKQVREYEDRGATVVKGTARIVGRRPWRVRTDQRELVADHVVVATGSDSIRPPIDGLDGVPVWTNREATTLRDIPGRVVMIGGGAVGVELGQFLTRMGSAVTLVQRGPRLLSREEPRVGELTADLLRSGGVDVRVGRQVTAARRDGADTVVDLDDGTSVRTDVVVLGAGRRPRVDALGLSEVGVEPDSQGALAVDGQCRVTDDGLWAVGDVTGVALFTHVAKYQGRIAAGAILGGTRTAGYTGVPRVVFADPEIAVVGLTRQQAERQGIEVAAAEVDLPHALARPWTYETEPTGTLGVLADVGRGVLVGAWAVAPMAGEWIHQAALAIRAAVPLEVLLDGVAQFPTYSEGFLTALEALPAGAVSR